MSIEDVKVGTNGRGVLAYGEHVVGGILHKWKQKVVGSSTIWSALVIGGMGEWDSCVRFVYDFEPLNVSDPSQFTFHRGTLSTGPDDPEQGIDARFPNGITYNRAAYWTFDTPAHLSAGDLPDKGKGVFRCLRVHDYDIVGGELVRLPKIYSANPALVTADLVFEQAGFALGRMHWNKLLTARDWWNVTVNEADTARIPSDIEVTLQAGGGLPVGNVFLRITAIDGTGEGAPSVELVVPTTATHKAISLKFTKVTGATGYRVYYGNTVHTQTNVKEVGDVDTVVISGGDPAGALPAQATGSFMVTKPRAEAQIVFSGVLGLDQALNSVMIAGSGEVVDDGRYIHVEVPDLKDVAYTFNASNILPNSFSFRRTDSRDRLNKLVGQHRNTLDPDLVDADPVIVRRRELSERVGVRDLIVNMGTGSPAQIARALNYQMRTTSDMNLESDLTAHGSSAHVLPGQRVRVIDDESGWTAPGLDFSVIEVTDESPDNTPEHRTFALRSWIEGLWSDTDGAPVRPRLTSGEVIPVASAPPPIEQILVTNSGVEVGVDGSITSLVAATVQFKPHVTRQYGKVWRIGAGDVPIPTGITVIPDFDTLQGSFEIRGLPNGVHRLKVQTWSMDYPVASALPLHPEFEVEVDTSVNVPDAVSNINAVLDGNRVVWTWTMPAGVRQVKIIAGGSIYYVTGNTWSEYPSAATLIRTFIALDGAGNESLPEVGTYGLAVPTAPTWSLGFDGRNLIATVTVVDGVNYEWSTNGSTVASIFNGSTMIVSADGLPVGNTTRYVRASRFGQKSAWVPQTVSVTAPAAPDWSLTFDGRNLISTVTVVDGVTYERSTDGSTVASTFTGSVHTASADGMPASAVTWYVRSSVQGRKSAWVAKSVTITAPATPTGFVLDFDGFVIGGKWVALEGTIYEYSTNGTSDVRVVLGEQYRETTNPVVTGIHTRYIRAVVQGRNSAWVSTTVNVTGPAIPTNLTAQFKRGIATVRFDRVNTAVRYELDNGSTVRSLTGNQLNDVLALNTASVTYKVRAFNLAGLDSGWSAPVVMTVPVPAAPTTANITYENGKARVTWNASVDADEVKYYLIKDGLGNVIRLEDGLDYLHTPTYGTSSLTVQVYSVGFTELVSNGHADKTLAFPAPANPSGFAVTFDGTNMQMTWTSVSGQTYQVSTTNSIAGLLATLENNRFTWSGYSTATRSHTFWLRALDQNGVPSGWVSFVLDSTNGLAAPVAPTLAKDASRQYPNSIVVKVTTTTPRESIRWTVVQFRTQGGSFPVSTAEGTSNVVRLRGYVDSVDWYWSNGGAAEMRVLHADVFGEGNWSSVLAHTFTKFGSADIGTIGDTNFDVTSNLAKQIAGRAQVPIHGGGDIRWSAGAANGELPNWQVGGSFNTSGFEYYSTAVTPAHSNGAVSKDLYSGNLVAEYVYTGDPAPAVLQSTYVGFSANQTLNATTYQGYAFALTIINAPADGYNVTLVVTYGALQVNLNRSFRTGDVFKITRDAANIFRVYQNGELIYTHGSAIAGALYIKTHSYWANTGKVRDIFVSGTTGTTNKLTWSTRFIALPVSTDIAAAGYFNITQPAGGLTLAPWQAVIGRFTKGSTSVIESVVTVLDYATYTPPAPTGTTFDVLIAVHNGDNGKLYLFDGRVLEAGQTIRAGAFFPIASLGRAFIQRGEIVSAHIGDAIIKNAHIDFIEANKIRARLAEFRIVFGDIIGSSNFVSSGAQGTLTEYPKFVISTNTATIDASGALSEPDDFNYSYNSYGMTGRGFHGGDCEFEIPLWRHMNARVGLLMNDTGSSTSSDIMFGVQWASQFGGAGGVNANKFVVYESGNFRTAEITYQTGDKFKIAISAYGVVTYYLNGVLVYTSTAQAPFPLFCKASPMFGTVDPPKMTGVLRNRSNADIKLRWRNVVNLSYDALDDLTKTGGAQDTWNAGASSVDVLPANTDGMVSMVAADTTSLVMCGFSVSDTNQDYATIGWAFYQSQNLWTVYENGVQRATGAAGSVAANDILSVSREAGVIKYRKNGLLLYTSTVSSNGNALVADTSFYRLNSKLKTPRLMLAGAIGQGWQATPTGAAEFNTGVKINGKDVVALADRILTSVTGQMHWRGNDLAAFLVHKVDSVTLDGWDVDSASGKAEFQIASNFSGYFIDDFANADSLRRCRLTVRNVFGEVVKDYPPFTFEGDGICAWGNYSSKYAHPDGQAIFELRFWNTFGWSAPLYMKAGVKSLTMPTTQKRAETPLELNGSQLPTSVNVSQGGSNIGWCPARANQGNQSILWRVIGESAWSSFGGQASSTNSINLFSDFGANMLFEVKVRNDNNNAESNVAVVKTNDLVSMFDKAPVGGLVSCLFASPLKVKLKWYRNTGAFGASAIKVYRDSVLVATLASNADEWDDTTIALGTRYTYMVKVDYGINGYANSTGVRVEVPATFGSAAEPTNLVSNTPANGTIDWTWNINSATGSVFFDYRIQGTSVWTTVNKASGSVSHQLTGLPAQTWYEARVRVSDAGAAASNTAYAYSDTYIVNEFN